MKKNIFLIFAISIIIAFLIALIVSAVNIHANSYIHYRMFRLAASILQGNLNNFISWSVVAAVVLTILLICFRIKLNYSKFMQSKVTNYIVASALTLIALSIVLNLCLFANSRINRPNGPNVIIIGIDTLRADHLSCYGYKRTTSPNIDTLANESLVFKKAFATSSWTLPCFHSILTSLYQISHGVSDDKYKLDDRYLTLAELLKQNGYKTAGFVSGPYLKSIFGFDQGFDLYEESVSSPSNIQSHNDITSPKLIDLALSWLSKQRNKNFFLFVHFWDPHYDFIPPAPYDTVFDPDYQGKVDGTNIEMLRWMKKRPDERDTEHIKSLYDGEILWTDMNIKKLFEALKEWDIYQNTIIVVVGDHGEEFYEHGTIGHQQTLFNESIHVPLILKIPGIDNPKQFDQIVSQVDIMPTILDVLDITHPSPIDGRTLLPVIKGMNNVVHDAVYSELYSDLAAIIEQEEKLIYNLKKQRPVLSDTNKSLFKTSDQQRIKLLKSKLLNWLDTKRSQSTGSTDIVKDKKTLEQLKSLGYMQ